METCMAIYYRRACSGSLGYHFERYVGLLEVRRRGGVGQRQVIASHDHGES